METNFPPLTSETQVLWAQDFFEKNELQAAFADLIESARFLDASDSTLQHPQNRQNSNVRIWLFVRLELHKFICEDSNFYKKERAAIKKSGLPLLTFVTGVIVGKFGIPYAAASALAGAVIMTVVKIGTTAWCEKYKFSRDRLTKEETEAAMALSKALEFDAH